ncbi:SMC-Scp complex subunit ScpB [candidate division WOR-3 bacterium]|nr:SMC-Scp complex subunit ScpB [candidate division WOR-3 bacterium]
MEENEGEKLSELAMKVEAILMTSDLPIGAEKIKNLVEGSQIRDIKECIKILNELYDSNGRSFHILEVAGGYQIYTRPQYADLVSKLDKSRESRLTQSALETLAVVAYKQPVTKAEIERIRGVSSDSPMKTLLERDLIHAVGRADSPGKPVLYATTREFLRFFQLNSLSDLPPMAEVGEEA